jgi:hypothetical protein
MIATLLRYACLQLNAAFALDKVVLFIAQHTSDSLHNFWYHLRIRLYLHNFQYAHAYVCVILHTTVCITFGCRLLAILTVNSDGIRAAINLSCSAVKP